MKSTLALTLLATMAFQQVAFAQEDGGGKLTLLSLN